MVLSPVLGAGCWQEGIVASEVQCCVSWFSVGGFPISVININFLNQLSQCLGWRLTSGRCGWASHSLPRDAVSFGGSARCLELPQQPGSVPALSLLPPSHGCCAEPQGRV